MSDELHGQQVLGLAVVQQQRSGNLVGVHRERQRPPSLAVRVERVGAEAEQAETRVPRAQVVQPGVELAGAAGRRGVKQVRVDDRVAGDRGAVAESGDAHAGGIDEPSVGQIADHGFEGG